MTNTDQCLCQFNVYILNLLCWTTTPRIYVSINNIVDEQTEKYIETKVLNLTIRFYLLYIYIFLKHDTNSNLVQLQYNFVVSLHTM